MGLKKKEGEGQPAHMLSRPRRRKKEEIEKANFIILPGVGAFENAMNLLKQKNYYDDDFDCSCYQDTRTDPHQSIVATLLCQEIITKISNRYGMAIELSQYQICSQFFI